MLVVERQWGKDNHADWYFNLQNQPQASIEVQGKTIKVNTSLQKVMNISACGNTSQRNTLPIWNIKR
ncbi:MAG: nitroreductase family deazaflavin-dependent oxidoreductase [Anaerolineales bacterium]|nr:nitroreductase family deazaflavin-dependent oxidoreductase [Anaerolineales bacterium]